MSELQASDDTKSKLKDLLLYVGENEIKIEILRQKLCKLDEFEPYTAFMRLDSKKTGFIDKDSLHSFVYAN
jgi:Ca2+-binding EF-hand superfamily protein